MIVLGLTGSIGMGKSTTARMFADRGIPVWDADASVHELYGPGGAAGRALSAIAGGAVLPDGSVDRARLKEAILEDPTLLNRVETLVHPLVAQDRNAFLQHHRSAGATLVLCDIPLLFETKADQWVDKIVVVTAPADVQRQRVLDRPGMTEQAFEAILAKQLPDAEKRDRADYVIDTSRGMDHARQKVAKIVDQLNA